MTPTRIPGKIAFALAVLWLAAQGVSCGRQEPQIGEAELARAHELLAPFQSELKSALLEALRVGPEAAIEVCRERAPAIAESLGRGGVEMGRASHRPRNPANAPEPWMEPLLEAYLREPTDRSPHWVDLGGGRVGYVEPIFAQGMCLACHGKAIAPSVKEKLESLYPEDRATGFAAGDLRGIFWLAAPLDSLKKTPGSPDS